MHSQTERDDRVRVSGIATYDEVNAERLDVSGVLTVAGDTHAERATFSGATTAQGSLRAGTVEISGATEVAGDAFANEVTVSGSLSVKGTTHADVFESSGSVQLEAVRTDQFEASGAVDLATLTADVVRIRGAIEAGRVEASDIGFALVSDSVVSHLVGDSVVVTRYRPDGFLGAESVEGDTVALDYVDVETVVGDHVQLGPNARVDVVRASELDVADGATVGAFERRE